MNYEKSQAILEEIKKAKKILVNLHRYPDPDSFASAFALYYFLISLDKKVNVVLSDKSKLANDLSSLPEAKLIKLVDFSKFKFEDYDLFISPDSAVWQQIVDDENVQICKIPITVIDHHSTNEKFGKINIVISEASSCTQVLYHFFQDCNYTITKEVADLLLLGIVTDTGAFQYASEQSDVFRVVADLIDLKANKKEIINKEFRTKQLNELNGWGYLLDKLTLDESKKFVWTSMTHDVYLKYNQPRKLTSIVAGMFSCIVENTDFGIVMVEEENGDLVVSLRSRTDFDVSKIAIALNGGGHKAAAAAKIEKMPFDKAVEKVLETARQYAKENS